ncbi:MAG TPA: aspartate aminotransferase family protein [Nordella sp.]|nr:aspartate aminotransferase family protein [Nordella sp.]
MTANDLYSRDAAAIGTLQKLRFFPSALTGGAGTRVTDQSGRSLLDLSAAWGSASLGYGHPALIEAVTRVVTNPAGASVLSSANLPAVELAEAVLATVPEIADAKVWLGHSGSDANEAMFRAVTAATGRSRIIAFAGAYHGGTAASMAISGHSVQTHAARHSGLTLIPYPAPSRPFMGDTTGARVLELVEHLLKTTCPGGEVAALFIEPIQSDGGMIVPPPGFLKELVALCRRYGILIVSDEVKVGLARTGRLHAFAFEGFVPDIVCFGKGLGGGLPLAAAVAPSRILDFASSFAMQTLHGNPISAAAGLAVLDTIKRDDLAENAADVGSYFREGLERLQQRHAMIRQVRGRGLAIGIELDPDRAKRYAAKTVYRAFELGLVLYYVGLDSNVLELTPPLILTREDVDEALVLLDQSLADVGNGTVSDQAIAPFAGW